MSASLTAIYDDLLMRHIRQAHHYGVSLFEEDEGVSSMIANPLCGDTLTLMRWKAHEPQQGMKLSFECECCGIAMGSASLMTLMLEGALPSQAKTLAESALATLKGAPAPLDVLNHVSPASREEVQAGWQLLFEIGQHMPARRTCASLGWQAVIAQSEGRSDSVAIEVK